MNELGAAGYADMGLHPEVPLFALAGLVHVRIALLLFVLGRTGCADNARVNDGAPGYLQSIFLEVLIHQVEQVITQIMFLHQMPEFANDCLVRHRLPAQINPHELAQGARVVKGFFCGWVGQVEPVLDEMDSQHALNADGAAAGALGFGIVGFDGLGQFLPGNNSLHLHQKLFLAGFPALLFKSGIRKGVLAHECLFGY